MCTVSLTPAYTQTCLFYELTLTYLSLFEPLSFLAVIEFLGDTDGWKVFISLNFFYLFFFSSTSRTFVK